MRKSIIITTIAVSFALTAGAQAGDQFSNLDSLRASFERAGFGEFVTTRSYGEDRQPAPIAPVAHDRDDDIRHCDHNRSRDHDPANAEIKDRK